MKLTKRLYTLSLTVTLFVTGFLLPGFSTSCTAQTETNSSPAYSCIKVPKSISFCDTEIDLTRYDRRERMDRELMAFTYMHSTSLQIIKRANRYFPIIESILKEQGVPDDFKYLMVIESNVNPLARSGAGAAGLWQFMSGTAREFGLEVNHHVELYPVPYPCAGRYRGAKYLYVCPSCCDVQPLEFNQSLIYENNSRRNELCCSQ